MLKDEMQQSFDSSRMIRYLLKQEKYANKADKEQARREWEALPYEELVLAYEYNQERKKK